MNIELHSVATLIPDPSVIDLPVVDHGWHSEKPAFSQIVASQTNVSLIVEVGTWLGQSAMRMAAIHLNARVICVDHWLGDLNQAAHAKQMVAHGYPTIYRQFLKNVAVSPYADRIFPLVQTSLMGAKLLGKLGRLADIVYIDGSHESPDVYEDCYAYWEILKPGGLMFGDDPPILLRIPLSRPA